MSDPYVFSSPNIENIPLTWWQRVVNFLIQRYDPTRVVAVLGRATEGVCTGLNTDWISNTLDSYRTEVTPNCYVFVWGPTSPLDRNCVPEELDTIALCELSTQTEDDQPRESTIDLLCALPGGGRGSKALGYIENFMKTTAGSELVKLNATQASWTFYWKCGYKIDYQDCSKALKKRLKEGDIENVKRVHEAIHKSGETSIPMVKELT